MAKRGRLEIMENTLKIIKENRNFIRPTVLLRKSKMSSINFKDYYNDLIKNGFIKEVFDDNDKKHVSLTEKGTKFLERYKVIIEFIDEFEL
jgi:predicted transcriptional regulator